MKYEFLKPYGMLDAYKKSRFPNVRSTIKPVAVAAASSVMQICPPRFDQIPRGLQVACIAGNHKQ